VRLGVKLKTVDLTISLESLSYFLARPHSAAVTKTRSVHPFDEPRETKTEPDKARRKETT
jgi:hypothetical protein